MRYVSIDIETLGLGLKAPIIEVACVFVDGGKIVAERETLVSNLVYHNCEPYAMSMHPKLLRRLATEPATAIDALACEMRGWLEEVGFDPCIPTVFAGKNVASFDIPRLDYHTHGAFTELINVHHRYLDPGSMFVRRGDELIPSLEEILYRCGINLPVTHTALDDARATVAVIERGLDGRPASHPARDT